MSGDLPVYSGDETTGSTQYEFTAHAEAMLPAPCPWWRRWWLKLRRKPLPTIQPPGTRPLTFEYEEDGIKKRIFIPAARIDFDSPWKDVGLISDDGIADCGHAGSEHDA